MSHKAPAYLAVAATAGLLVLTACSRSSTPNPPASTTASPLGTSASDTPTVSSSPTASGGAVAVGSSANPGSGGAPTSAPPGASHSPPCSALVVTAAREPGAAGSSFALLKFTNSAASTCSISGWPTVSLLGPDRAPVAGPAAHAGAPGNVIELGPGAVASTLLADDSATCQANSRSAFVRIVSPVGGQPVELPLSLPPCSLSVKPVVAGSQPSP